jgi:hypothetical protein
MSRHTSDVTKKSVSSATVAADPDRKSIEALAYELWLKRGCPVGSDQEDWFRAERELRNAGSAQRAA